MNREEFEKRVYALANYDGEMMPFNDFDFRIIKATLMVAAELLRTHENGWHPHELADVLESLTSKGTP